MSPTCRLLVVTDRSQLPLGASLRSTLAACADAGLTHVLLRELDLAPAQRADLCRALTDLGLAVVAARSPLPGCVGVHLAAHQPGADAGGLPFGRSCHCADDVRRADRAGAGWATLGPFAPTVSKPGREPVGRAHYADLAPTGADGPVGPTARSPLTTYALGGVTPDNAADALAAGAHGVAVMGAVMRAPDPARLVRALLEVTGSTEAAR